MTKYVALLRGINVGGKNIIKMADLRACLAAVGFEDVATYIQSGNVLFATKRKRTELVRAIEEALSDRFAYEASVVLRSQAEMRAVIGKAPDGFGVEPKSFRYDVLFLRPSLGATRALAEISLKDGVDTADPGPGVLYFRRLIAKASQSRLTRIVGTPIYQQMTIRNWNTTTKLAEMMGL